MTPQEELELLMMMAEADPGLMSPLVSSAAS